MMNNDEIEKKKKELMEPHWTEDLHYALKELDDDSAKKIVELMSDDEIYDKVNNRQFQQDYIADYLEYLWNISQPAYWRHVISTLDIHHGILWGDNMSHFEKLCQYELSADVFNAVMYFAVNCDEKNKQDMEAIGCVIKAQAEKFDRLSDIRAYISELEGVELDSLNKRIDKMLTSVCNYGFY